LRHRGGVDRRVLTDALDAVVAVSSAPERSADVCGRDGDTDRRRVDRQRVAGVSCDTGEPVGGVAYGVIMIIDDFKYGWRQLIKAPGFTITAILTLGLAIGANTAVFSLVDAVLLKSLPYPRPERLATMGA